MQRLVVRVLTATAVVMVSVVDAQREILLDPHGTNVWRCVLRDWW